MIKISIKIITPARLHLGQIDLNGSHNRMFGGLGVAIDQPNVQLEIRASDTLQVTGLSCREVEKLALQFYTFTNLTPAASIEVVSVIPAHVGLGSGTQLAMAVGMGLAKHHNLPMKEEEMARLMDRGGSRSSIGLGSFIKGGFLVDGGRRVSKEGPKQGNPTYIPPIIARHRFPEDWKFVVAIPDKIQGLHGQEEMKTFQEMDPMPPEMVGTISWVVLMKLLPALVEEDIVSFGEALNQMEEQLDIYFRPVQEETPAHKMSTYLIQEMKKRGALCSGQSSWGPTVYGLVRKSQAASLEQKVKDLLQGTGQVFVASVKNQGATFTSLNSHK